MLLAGGCVSTKSHLTLTPQRTGVTYRQKFTRCYAQRDPAGDYQFFLVHDGLSVPADRNPAAPLEPVPNLPVHQIVHVHMFWRPMRGAKPDNPSSTNSSIDWYFIANQGLPNQSVVEYHGSGFVTVHPSTKTVAVNILSAAIYPEKSTGSLHDPFGASTITGDFLAQFDAIKVRQLKEEIKQLNH